MDSEVQLNFPESGILGLVLQGRYEEAASQFITIFENRHVLPLNGDNLESSDDMVPLALLNSSQGRVEEAESLLRRVLARRQQRYGLAHVKTLKSINYLGDVLVSQEKYDEAEELLRCVSQLHDLQDLEQRTQALKSVEALTRVLAKRHKLDEAEKFGRWTVREYETLLGNRNLDTLIAIHTLAGVLMAADKREEAVTRYNQAYSGTQQRLGDTHPDTQEFYEDYQSARRSYLRRHFHWTARVGFF